MFILKTFKCELIKQLYNIKLRRIPSQQGDVSVRSIIVSIPRCPSDKVRAMYRRFHIFKGLFSILSSFQYVIIVSIPHSGTVRNTNDDRYSDFGHCLKMSKRLYIEKYPHFLNVYI